MRIGVDVRPLAFSGTGNATYLHRMLSSLLSLRSEDDWIFFSHRGIDPEFSDILHRGSIELISGKQAGAVPGPIWLHTRLPVLLKEYECDLLWGTLAMLPVTLRKSPQIKSIVNFHDLNSFRAPKTMVRWKRWQHRLLDRRSIETANRVVCLSNTTRNDILEKFPRVDPEKLRVVYPGCELATSTIKVPNGAIGNLGSFILCVGTLEPRKNQKTLVEAYLLARESTPSIMPLVIIGRKGWGDDRLHHKLKIGIYSDKNIYYLDDAPNQILSWAYQNATIVALPSVHEGFGLPIIEAFQYGKPAILSDIPIFREIGGPSLYVPPMDILKWRDALLRMNKMHDQSQLPTPEFDKDEWSWKNRANQLNCIFQELQSE